MSRNAIYKALTTDPELISMGIGPDQVFANHSLDTPPRSGKFVNIRWAEHNPRGLGGRHKRGPRNMVVWVHIPREQTLDHAEIDPMLNRIKDVLSGMEHIRGDDGSAITMVTWTGDSADLTDIGYDTIVRNAGFEVLSRRV